MYTVQMMNMKKMKAIRHKKKNLFSINPINLVLFPKQIIKGKSLKNLFIKGYIMFLLIQTITNHYLFIMNYI